MNSLTWSGLKHLSQWRLTSWWAFPGLNLKDTTGRIVMRAKCILYTMNCQRHVRLTLQGKIEMNILIQRAIEFPAYLPHQNERYRSQPNMHSHSWASSHIHWDKLVYFLNNDWLTLLSLSNTLVLLPSILSLFSWCFQRWTRRIQSVIIAVCSQQNYARMRSPSLRP